MALSVLVDTGPLVAWLNRGDAHHAWARDHMARLHPPLFTCEAVLTEVTFLLDGVGRDPSVVPELLTRGVLQVALDLEDEAAAVTTLMRKYGDVPMSLADACLVRLSELRRSATVMTLDSDFHVYRRHGRLVIPTLMPAEISAGQRR